MEKPALLDMTNALSGAMLAFVNARLDSFNSTPFSSPPTQDDLDWASRLDDALAMAIRSEELIDPQPVYDNLKQNKAACDAAAAAFGQAQPDADAGTMAATVAPANNPILALLAAKIDRVDHDRRVAQEKRDKEQEKRDKEQKERDEKLDALIKDVGDMKKVLKKIKAYTKMDLTGKKVIHGKLNRLLASQAGPDKLSDDNVDDPTLWLDPPDSSDDDDGAAADPGLAPCVAAPVGNV
ncbi:hypothetical protein Rhopal_006410-T1 [Rhodotorula paludigena]|uniref:Mediator of RNA polymerase II transcription subunit 21 n=1 Tax=Rhodotorula paludigena TaxID=86838 RepID=A0AAV5GVI0_9BASI|nr:hypothetical protein Rhopal_006410-T1 [Rhodotorula paludigena]